MVKVRGGHSPLAQLSLAAELPGVERAATRLGKNTPYSGGAIIRAAQVRAAGSTGRSTVRGEKYSRSIALQQKKTLERKKFPEDYDTSVYPARRVLHIETAAPLAASRSQILGDLAELVRVGWRWFDSLQADPLR